MRSLFVFLPLLVGCAHHPVPELVVNERRPYEGIPAYLHCPPPVVAATTKCPFGPLVAAREQPRDFTVGGELQPTPPISKAERLQRLRAVLAAVDAHVAELGDRPSHEQITLLKLSVKEMRGLLEAWPDTLAEADELDRLVDELETTMPIQLPLVRRRMSQLADLIRLQVVVGEE
jgi:hypothetical protein